MCRRGEEGLCKLKKNAIQKFEYGGVEYWQKVTGECSKNHQNDSEDLGKRAGAKILFEENFCGFNPGLYMSLFFDKLHEKAEYLFCRPKRGRRFLRMLREENPDCWYEAVQNVGVNQVRLATPKMTEAAEIERATNHQLRATHITVLVDNGVQDREVQHNSHHVSEKSIVNYKKHPSLKRQLEMASIINNGGKSPKRMKASGNAARSDALPKNHPSTSSSNTKKPNGPSTSSSSFKKPNRKNLPSTSSSSFKKTNNESNDFQKLPDDDFDVDELDLQLSQIEDDHQKFLRNEQVTKNATETNGTNEKLPDDDFDANELDSQLTQVENDYQKFLKNEQVLKLQEMQIMMNFQKRMEESEKRRYELAKRFKFKKLN